MNRSGAAFFFAMTLAGTIAAAGKPLAVVEIFTAEGCDACPPADRFAASLAADPDLLVLGYHVDYWDYLGWKDSLARPEYTQRQSAYAASRGGWGIFTPEIIVNGRNDLDGGGDGVFAPSLQQALKTLPALTVPVEMTLEGNSLRVELGATADYDGPPATVTLVTYRTHTEASIERGANSGRRIVYIDAVDRLQSVGVWTGNRSTLILPIEGLFAEDGDDAAVIVQSYGNGRLGEIIGAARLGRNMR